MFTRHDLESLAAYEAQNHVVSLYLNLDPRLRSKAPEAYQAEVKTMLKKIDDRASSDLLDAVDTFFESEFDWIGQSVVLFADENRELWYVERFEVPLQSHIHLGRKPFISPLANLLTAYGDYSLALVEQQAARLIHFRFGAIIEDVTHEGEDVKRLKSGGGAGGASGSAHRGSSDQSSHNREVVNRNLKNFADHTMRFCQRHNASYVLLSGTDTTVSQFEGALPQAWRERVIGRLNLATQAPENELRKQTLEAMKAHQERHEQTLIASVMTEAAREGAGVTGIDPTLEAIHAGRVQTLALVEGFHIPGYRCPTCGFATTQTLGQCPYSSDDLLDVPNIIEHAIRRVIEQGGDVAVVTPGKELSDVGALLRY